MVFVWVLANASSSGFNIKFEGVQYFAVLLGSLCYWHPNGYKGELGDYYCMAAKAAGRPCPDYKRMHEGFKYAYKDMAKDYPCFGFAAKMPNIVWWKTCVRDSFVRAGYDYDEETFEKVFRRIYASFGSSAPYTVFPDSKPFLRWLREKGLKVGIVSNAEYRYRDVILPALGLNQIDEITSR
ncbi:hypothetical protein P8452_52877 [Trifolium repens]|nr:hypothetical protein P8452_52877 [Trifolium repens]